MKELTVEERIELGKRLKKKLSNGKFNCFGGNRIE